jgi:hypothetical protein
MQRAEIPITRRTPTNRRPGYRSRAITRYAVIQYGKVILLIASGILGGLALCAILDAHRPLFTRLNRWAMVTL